MSRCSICGFHFEEDNGWQELCSKNCAMIFFAGRLVTADDKEKNTEAWKKWNKALADSKKVRLIKMDGEPAKEPSFGQWETRWVEIDVGRGANKHKELREVRVNVAGEKVIPIPFTDADRCRAKKQRGRGKYSFGDCLSTNRNMPSQDGRIGEGWFPHD